MARLSRLIGIVFGALFCVGCVSDKVAFKEEKIIFNGDSHPYAVYTPANYDPAKAYPTVVFLHGLFEGGSDGKSQTRVGIGPAIQKNPDRWNCVVIMPQTSSNWQKSESIDLASAVLDDASKKYHLDPKSITITGLSNGGAGAWLLGAKYPGRFAGLAPICAFSEYDSAPKLTGIPIWAFHNKGDFIVGAGGSKEMVERINRAGGNATITLYGGIGHNCWDKTYEDPAVVAWLQKPVRK